MRKNAATVESVIRGLLDGVRNVIRLLGAGNEKIRRLKAEKLVDDSVVKKFGEGRPVLVFNSSVL